MTDNSALHGLYPFLHGDRQDAGKLRQALIEFGASEGAR